MFNVEPKNKDIKNNFIKKDSQMLNQMWGSDDVVPYWVADMDFPIAPSITQELQRLVTRETFSYEFDSESVFSSISKWNSKRHGLDLNPKNFVQVPGVLSAIGLLIREFSAEDEGVLIQSPVYHQFRRLIESAGRVAVDNTLKLVDDHYQIDFDDFEAKLKHSNVKIVLLCNPHNPVGRVWKRAELEKLVAIAKKHQTLIISDEIHADIVFEGSEFTSIVSLGYDNTISIIGSPAKNFGLSSISNGYIYSDNAELHAKVKAMSASMSLDHGNALTTYATIAAYQHGEEWFNEFLNYTQTTMNWIREFLETNLPQVKVYKPEGTNQIWLDFTGLGLEPEQLKELLVMRAKMALTPGSWFGEPDSNYYRMNFASPLPQIKASLNLLLSEIQKLS
ncbi:aminotransferase class I/II-fold pyridoxal phosphate-dependent enzyme [Vibrio alginolyticus]|nr:aminotransferase class I/II-fold pyridoxal phosphate-dependent enzyme [Vibrio alginolyticus]EJL6784705.1 aminotransferase class I/II-fold pyridoxal phosphate-dependent enzyme [Vibrio alginolyticus]ELB2854558.1 aminotransferase class I/II-fold pyridoxal phosphate-dependent enzyme [Vibrio alginolyticus]